MSRLLDRLASGKVLLMDGAMGTELLRAGLAPGDCGEMWNLTAPEKVRAIHQAYVDAGADVLLPNTFQANPHVLEKHGQRQHLEEIQQAGARLAGAAAGPERFLLADVGPVRGGDSPVGTDLRTIESILPELKTIDGLLLETFSDPLALMLARQCQVVTWAEGKPVLLSLAYEKDGSGRLCTHSRHPPEWFALQAEQYGVAALGVNCGKEIGLDDLLDIVHRYRKVTRLPIFARPNAGTPAWQDGRWVYPLTPEKLAERLPELIEAGVAMIGGCCGTTPEHVRAMRRVVDEWNELR